jgi:hypothetical protein
MFHLFFTAAPGLGGRGAEFNYSGKKIKERLEFFLFPRHHKQALYIF